MMTARRRKIRLAVDGALKRLGVVEPPVQVERLPQLCGAKLRYVPHEDDISGVLFREDGHAIIGVNALHSKTRQRFTIAHEIAHLELHEGGEIHVDRAFEVYRNERSSQASDIREMEANAFAAELLMPTDLLKKDLSRIKVDYENDDVIRALAERYKVSPQAMTFRLMNLGVLRNT